MLNNGAQMSQVSSILSHASVAVTSTIYARHDVKNLGVAYDAYAAEEPIEQTESSNRV
jgi:integrase